ncbi:carbohydrate ABC transporter permease [Blautia sp. HCP3S3_H10_1]|uniref:carbohydrate ABC transporter permease n=1 Tax=unclassified Blautia TaxID=2648079 RepID=UPI003F902A15
MKKNMKKSNISQPLIYVLFSILLVIFLVPFFLVLLNSFKGNKEIILDPLALPEKLNIAGYMKAFSAMNYLQTFRNSLIITVLSIVLIILFAVMCAYFFARNNWKINRILFMIMVASMIIPFQTIMIPIVKNFSAINAVDNIFMVVVFYIGAHISMAVFMLQGFIKNIPVELDEAARIDGCSEFQILFKIIFPLLKPIISTVAVLDILAIWNDFLLPYILLQSNKLKTLPLMTYSFFGQYSVDYSLVCSGLIMSILPVIIIYAFLQKQIIDGVVAGAIK